MNYGVKIDVGIKFLELTMLFSNKKIIRNSTTALIIIFYSSVCLAHSGGTDSNGCHNDNIHGGYHCHNGSSDSGGSSDSSVGNLIGGIAIGFLILYIFGKINDRKKYSYQDRYLMSKDKKPGVYDNKTPTSDFNCGIIKSCSELTSCEEAKFYFNHCIGTKINNFCEARWCSRSSP